jgi:hypothetical protein
MYVKQLQEKFPQTWQTYIGTGSSSIGSTLILTMTARIDYLVLKTEESERDSSYM